MPDGSLTIGRLARAAEVGIETVRYYQQRKLLPVPAAHGAFRHYNADAVNRIRFIKRARTGFSLAESAITEIQVARPPRDSRISSSDWRKIETSDRI